MKKQQLKIGDIFYLETESKNYVFGRILFDVDKQYHKVVNTDAFPHEYFPYLFMSHNGCQLVEMYKGIYNSPEFVPSEVLIPRVFTKCIDGKRNILTWGIVGNKPVDYTQVEFPEHLNNKNGILFLDRGELSIKTQFKDNDSEPNLKTNIFIPAVISDACLFWQGRKDLIRAPIWPDYIRNKDLLYYPELRKEIYDQISKDARMSYYELSKKEGFDLERFYDKKLIGNIS